MNGSILGGLGQGLQNFIQTYTQLHQNELEKKRQAAMDQMNFQSHAATMENQALQRALTQAQLESLPRQQATNQLENMLKVQGDQAYNNPAFAETAQKAGMPFQTKQVPLESRNISGTVQGPGLSNIVDKALNMPVNAVNQAAKGSLNVGPMQTKTQLAREAGVAPNTGVVLPEDVRKRGERTANLDALLGSPNVPDAVKSFLKVRDMFPEGSVPATLFAPEKGDTAAEMDGKYQTLLQKKGMGQKLTPEETAYVGAYEQRKTLGPRSTFEMNTGNRNDARNDKGYQANSTVLQGLRKPIADQAERLSRLADSINVQSPQADALIAPELLTAMAGGMGSGLRINEAEITRVVGGRSNFESLKASLNRWALDPQQALSVTPAQRQQMRDLMGLVADKNAKKLQALNAAQDALIDAPDVGTQRRALAAVQREIDVINGAGLKKPAPSGANIVSVTEIK
jgi:hypothetical protein